jgi:hypothetical protein
MTNNMAGLSANIVTSKNRAYPSWPRAISPSYYYGQMHPQTNPRYFEGFQNDSVAGSSIKFGGLSSADTLVYYNGQGTQITDGVWNSAGLTVAEAWSDGNNWAGAYLDSSDDKLYLLVRDTGTTPDTLRMTSVDKDGTVVLETAAFQVTNTAFNTPEWHHSAAPKLYRVGQVDGTGNFRYDVMNANTDDDDNNAPYDGCRIEINTSGGTVNSISANTMAETSDGVLPNNFYTPTAPYDNMMGPTDNNIVGGPTYNFGASYGDSRLTGTLVNMTTGNSSYHMPFGKDCPFYPTAASSSFNVMNWNGNVRFFGLYTYGFTSGGSTFDRGEYFNFMDELAVFYGIL